ncbi:hypothetical protein GCM10007962_23950 [Yeosuana aromativorans]|uniref:BioF2-like acetyltransferase domain-containing protein n=1 Tax=Yeosuana aromativorans TaxID=288019 RepID=A0A8J3FHJ8_9FLAO|nr:GNAT family N-acetyltransferase [Yeosuana aromativorans]GGK28933.1 hypothetical protein GCM10007962_23950 [Yeosuana aromativorans]
MGSGIHEIRFIPSYFDLKSADLDPKYITKKYYRVDNFLINLVGYKTAEDYMKDRLGPKSRSQWRRRLHRLETCFNIEYKFYYGNISKQEYESLYATFELFIKRRFNQRDQDFSFKDKWDIIKTISYKKILEKKASLFVIYADGKPIDICLSYHYQNIMLHLIRSYDIDYSKFWLGQIDMFKQIEFCFSNNFKIFDLMWGELEYKNRWCNKKIKYEHHITYNKKSLTSKLLVIIILKLYSIKDFFKRKDSLKFFDNLKYFIKNKTKNENILYTNETLTEIPDKENLTKLNLNLEAYSYLRKPAYDFQYLNFESSENLKVFKINNEKNAFIINGQASCEKIIFRN